jgi:transglutaminase-like putative cysteine protease
MQSASLSPRLRLALLPGRAWGHARSSMAGGLGWSALLILLLTLAIARSTATAAWVQGIDIVTAVALGGALLLGVLAIIPLPWAVCLGAGMVAGPVVAAFAAGPALHALHPSDVLSIGLAETWWHRLTDGSASNDPAFYLYLICLLMWVTGGWLSWCVIRWRRPMLGLVPGAAAFATNLLNYPADQNGYTLAVLVLTLALLLWTNYTASIANATRARVKMTGDARWDFWESGLVAMAALIVIAILLPPLSTVDRTLEAESSLFSRWAQIQQRLSHTTILGSGKTGPGTTGFSTDVSLNSALARSRQPVFSYTLTSDAGLRYFRGVNVTRTFAGVWQYPSTVHFQERIAKDQVPVYTENYKKLAVTLFQVRMITAPSANSDILFYPGILYKTDRETVASEVDATFAFAEVPSLTTIDRLSSVSPPFSTGNYVITTEYSTATEADLKQAGTSYPDWVAPYSSLPPTGYRSKAVLDRIKQRALQVTEGAATPYDKAKAIENYLRDGNTFTYTLTPPKTPAGVDPLEYFLFNSHKGFCQFFATAMGDMLRSLGIPTRLVNGFGPGSFDSATHAYLVRGEDAHTWVETYFPQYGWITFEPTPDGLYNPISRGAASTNPCLRDNNCDNPGGTPTAAPPLPPVQKPGDVGPQANPGGAGGAGGIFTFKAPDAGTVTRIVGVLLALLLLLFGAAARYLRPRKVTAVWKRTQVLARLAGAERRAGETPLELGRRWAREFPEASEPALSLANGFAVSAYAPPELAKGARASVMEAWAALRPMLLRRVASRLHLTRA